MAIEPRYISTNGKSPKVTLKEAVLKGIPDDGGLYLPERFRVFPRKIVLALDTLSLQEIALEVSKVLLGEDLEESVLKEVIEESITFDLPLIQLEKKIHVLELFHGPTLAFKDFGARFMARLMGYFMKNESKPLTVLVATSGDTGSAVANGFWKVPGINVVVLYPQGKISSLQEKQITTLGENITALEVAGTFDDCQKLVKEALVDKEINQHIRLTSANSINLARLYPQTFYYFSAFGRCPKKELAVSFSVPSGNFGNLTAGLISKKIGLPVSRFIAATNLNDSVPKYLETGHFMPDQAKETLSTAMDVGNPSNFKRMLHLYRYSQFSLGQDVWGKSFNDQTTLRAMKDIYHKHNYIMDPHSALAYIAAERFLEKQRKPHQCICLETAHPAKFLETVKEAIDVDLKLPKLLSDLKNKEKVAVQIPTHFEGLKERLLSKISS